MSPSLFARASYPIYELYAKRSDVAYWTATPPGNRKFLSADEFAATYGAEQTELDQVAGFARLHGLSVTEASASRRGVVVSGTAEQMSRAFAVELGRYESGRETYRSHDGHLNLPENIADLVVDLGLFQQSDAGFLPDSATVTLTSKLVVSGSPYQSSAQIYLVQTENPYFVDVSPTDPEQPSWLSFDLRVRGFQP
jgi:subtilase family serine protease